MVHGRRRANLVAYRQRKNWGKTNTKRGGTTKDQPGTQTNPPEFEGAHGRERAHVCERRKVAWTATADVVAPPPIRVHEGHISVQCYDAVHAAETGL